MNETDLKAFVEQKEEELRNIGRSVENEIKNILSTLPDQKMKFGEGEDETVARCNVYDATWNVSTITEIYMKDNHLYISFEDYDTGREYKNMPLSEAVLPLEDFLGILKAMI